MGYSQKGYPNLPAIRHQKGIALEAVSSETHIGKRYLDAIERGEFKVLPGGIYNTSYIRQYARAVDYDEDELLGYYCARTRPPAPTADAESTRTLFSVNIFKLRKA